MGRSSPPREELVARFAAGRTFADVGCMWQVDGALCFAAEAAGATAVTGVDVMAPTPAFVARQAAGSVVSFVQGDVHDPAVVDEVGVHDVVWCSGVLYHAPHPLLTIERLRALTGSTLLLATEVLPEVPGLRRSAVFAPDPGAHPTHTEPLDPARGYHGWWWGLSRSAVVRMLEVSGFRVAEEHRTPHHVTVVAQREE